MDNRAIENLRAERTRIDLIHRVLDAMNWDATRASGDVRKLLAKLRDHEAATDADLARERRAS
jgi:hypothetical protein